MEFRIIYILQFSRLLCFKCKMLSFNDYFSCDRVGPLTTSTANSTDTSRLVRAVKVSSETVRRNVEKKIITKNKTRTGTCGGILRPIKATM